MKGRTMSDLPPLVVKAGRVTHMAFFSSCHRLKGKGRRRRRGVDWRGGEVVVMMSVVGVTRVVGRGGGMMIHEESHC